MNKTKTTRKTAKKTSLARHITASLVSTAPHKHTGQALHHRHTSHGALLIALFLTGILLFSNIGVLRAYGLSSAGTRTISVRIAGDPPTTGADIVFPTTNSTTQSPYIQVRGGCEAGTLVATYNNGVFAGSSMCTSESDYATTVQLIIGVNILQSQNYDGLNQAGPVTAQVTITREKIVPPLIVTPTEPTVPEIATTKADISPIAVAAPIPQPTAPQPSENPCFTASKKDLLDPKSPTIIAHCIHRSIEAGEILTLPIRIAGGTAPFALSIDWGDDIRDLKNVIDTNFHNYQHTYQNAGIINVTLKSTDVTGATSFLQTVVQVNGATAANTSAAQSTFGTITAGLGSLWTKAPVPMYWAAVTLVLGFWAGDILQRLFNQNHTGNKKRRPSSRRHA